MKKNNYLFSFDLGNKIGGVFIDLSNKQEIKKIEITANNFTKEEAIRIDENKSQASFYKIKNIFRELEFFFGKNLREIFFKIAQKKDGWDDENNITILFEKPFIPYGLKYINSENKFFIKGVLLGALINLISTYFVSTAKINFVEVMPNSWKSYYSIKGDKKEAIKLANDMGLETDNDNVADAYLLSNFFIKKRLS